MDKSLSDRIAVIRFPLIVGVVYLHAYGTSVSFLDGVVGVQPEWYATIVMDYISCCLAAVSVPLFYVLSGFLFFYDFNFSKKEYLYKIKSRIRSLAVPFLFWNILVLTLFAIGQAVPYTARYFSGQNRISSINLFDCLNLIFGLNRWPIAIQFWFIRDLILLVFLVPLINFAIKRLPALFLGTVFLMWLFSIWPLYIPSAVAVCFFSLGAFGGRKKYNIGLLDAHGRVFFSLYIVLSIADEASKRLTFNLIIHNIGLVFGVLSALFLSRYLCNNKRLKNIVDKLTPATFFVFATHVLLLAILKKLSYMIYKPHTDLSVIALYFLLPIATITVCVNTYYLFSKQFPSLTRIVTGGR